MTSPAYRFSQNVFAGMASLALSTAASGCGLLLPETRSPSQQDHSDISAPPHDDPQAHDLFKRLSQRSHLGKSLLLRNIDTGCALSNFQKPGPNAVQMGEHDGKLQPCEIYRYILEHHEVYRDLAEELAMGPIPWEIDKKTQERVRDISNAIEVDLYLLGWNDNESRFQRVKATALFWFTLSPSQFNDANSNKELSAWKEVLQMAQPSESEIKTPLFERELFHQGGLNMAAFKSDPTGPELTAMQALKTGRGECTEASYILFAVLRAAGMSPFFVSTTRKALEGAYGSRAPFYLRASGFDQVIAHTLIGLPSSAQTPPLFFDPINRLLFPRLDNYYPHDLHQALAVYLNNKGVLNTLEDHLNARTVGKSYLEQSIRLEPAFPNTRANYNQLLFQEEVPELLR